MRYTFMLACLACGVAALALAATGVPSLRGDVPLTVRIHPGLISPSSLGKVPDRMWIRFRDHGSQAGHKAPITERAAQRRLLRGVALDTPERQPVAPEYIAQIKALGGQVRRVSRWLNAVSVDYDPALVRSVATLPSVSEVLPVAGFSRSPEPAVEPAVPGAGATSSTSMLNYGPSAAQLQQIKVDLAHNRGYSGNGVLVAMFDSGFRKDHEAFAAAISEGRLLAEWDFVFNDGNVQNEPADDPSAHSHGTSTWSTLGGESPNQLYGPAYGASFILAKTEDIRSETQVEEDNWMAAMEWADSIGADVISSSLTYSDWYTNADYNGLIPVTTQAANMAATLGIVVCNSAGNGGPSARTIGAPVDGFYLLSVGSVTSTGAISSFSSHGPTADNRIKPEVCARGSLDYVASAGGTNTYGNSSGTSFSCPLIGGCSALIIEAHPTWNPLMVREALMQTASDPGTPDNTFGWGIADVNSAIDYKGSVQIQVLNWPDTVVSYSPQFDLRILASSISPLDMSGSSLYYSVDGGSFTSLPLDSADTLKAHLPAPATYRSTIDFYVVVKDSVGFVARKPVPLDSNYTLVWQTLLVGDLNFNLFVESADVIKLVNYVFKSDPPPDPLAVAEINGQGAITSADIIYLVNYVFKGGPPPVFPGS